MTEREAVIALNMVDELGPVRVRALMDAFGSSHAVWEASEKALMGVQGIGPRMAAAIVRQRGECDPVAEERRAAACGARIVTHLDAEYPANLKTIHDPPLALYVRGKLTQEDGRAMAIVGSRRCTHYGRSVADRFAFQLARAGFTVVSGLARGIDWAAHEGALNAEGRTVAVLGSALDTLYPPEAGPLADRIVERQGAVVSEYTMGRKPDRTTFPYRNRVISGWSLGVIVVEADIQSGAMITAAQALEQGRTVFAVPGRLDSPASRGTHRLIKQGARLMEDLADVYDELDYLKPAETGETQPEMPGFAAFSFSADEERVVQALVGEDPPDVDSLAREVGMPAHKLSTLLVGLEMKRVVRMLPGRRVALAVRISPETATTSTP
ncbi:MAG: DNA-processing protein DprA [Kiritimatiellia bacterium]|nr:DNA-processing protein DprA [Kiritimatiellia bacterium]